MHAHNANRSALSLIFNAGSKRISASTFPIFGVTVSFGAMLASHVGFLKPSCEVLNGAKATAASL
jgi:hypothetical protein